MSCLETWDTRQLLIFIFTAARKRSFATGRNKLRPSELACTSCYLVLRVQEAARAEQPLISYVVHNAPPQLVTSMSPGFSSHSSFVVLRSEANSKWLREQARHVVKSWEDWASNRIDNNQQHFMHILRLLASSRGLVSPCLPCLPLPSLLLCCSFLFSHSILSFLCFSLSLVSLARGVQLSVISCSHHHLVSSFVRKGAFYKWCPRQLQLQTLRAIHDLS